MTDKKAKILLLNPPTAEPSSEPLLNLGYLASSLRANGHEAKIIDATAPFNKQTPGMIEETIVRFKPDFIGATLTIMYIPQTYEYLKLLRKFNIPIVAGGPHANALPEEVIEHGADIVAIGEGEATIIDLAEHFTNGKPLEAIPGIFYKGDAGRYHFTPQRELIKDLDSIPFPDFDDFPIENYTGSKDPDSNPIFWSIFSSRGCPFNCTFCSSHNVFGRTIRLRSAQNVFDEIKSIAIKHGAKKITFQDDELMCNKKRFLDFCDLLISSGLGIIFTIRTRIDSIDREILEKGMEAGLRRISFGIESWNNDTLLKVNKKYDITTLRDKFKIIEDSGFPYISFNDIVGFPWEHEEHMRNNLSEIARIPSNIAYFTDVVTPLPFPKTVLYEQYREEYNFTNWWLKPENHPVPFASKPFFLYFAMRFFPLYVENRHWNYSEGKGKMIVDFCWKAFKLFIKRHYGLSAATVICALSRFSWAIWRISPAVEKVIFMAVPELLMRRVTERLRFVSKY